MFIKLASEGNGIIHGSGIAIDKSVLGRDIFFDEEFKMVEDWPFFLKLFKNGLKINFIRKTVVKYRLGGTSNGEVSNKDFLNDGVNIIKKEILPFMNRFRFNHTERYFVRYSLFKHKKKKYKVSKQFFQYICLVFKHFDVFIEKILRIVIKKTGINRNIKIC